jgi:hypothetical protein
VSKAAPLASAVVVVKGQAAAAGGSEGRGLSEPPTRTESRGRPLPADEPVVASHVELRPLSFKVPPDFDDAFRELAFRRRMKLNELLFAAFEAYREKSGIRETMKS